MNINLVEKNEFATHSIQRRLEMCGKMIFASLCLPLGSRVSDMLYLRVCLTSVPWEKENGQNLSNVFLLLLLITTPSTSSS